MSMNVLMDSFKQQHQLLLPKAYTYLGLKR